MTVLNSTISETKAKLTTMKEAMKKADAQGVTEKNSASYRRLQREIATTEAELKGLESEYKRFGSVSQQQLIAVGGKMKTIGSRATELGRKFSGLTVAMSLVGGAGLSVAMDFESSMSQVQATMGITKDAMTEVGGESVNTMDALSNLAKEMGSKTAFSATEAGEALNYLALAGYDTQEMMDTLPTVLNLAAAGGLDLASASDMVTDAMSALGMKTSDADVMVDQMAKTASSTNTSVGQLGEGILKIGGTAKTLKGGTAELNTALGILANNGIKSAEGGTHLRNVIMSLQNPTSSASSAMKQLGVDVYDSEGNMRSLNDILSDLNNGMSEMTTSEKQNIISSMFNKTDISSVNALLASTGKEWSNLQNSIADSGGAASDMAETQLDNLSGQITILKSALEGVAISVGDTIAPMVGKLAEAVQKAADWFNNLSERSKKIIVTMAMIAAAIGPILMIFGAISSGVGSIISTVGTLGNVFGRILPIITRIGSVVTKIIPLLTGPVGLVVAAVVAVVAVLIAAYKNSEQLRTAVSNAITQIKAALQALWSQLQPLLVTLAQTLLPVIKTFVTAIGNVLARILPLIVGHITRSLKVITLCISGIRKLVNVIRTVAGVIKSAIQAPFNKVKSTVTSLVSTIKRKFNSIKSLKWLKIPHIKWGSKSIAGKTFQYPTGISWHRKAMDQPYLLNGATIFGASGNSLLGGGEAGSEMILGTNTLQRMISESVTSAIVTMGDTVASAVATGLQVGNSGGTGGASTVEVYLFRNGPQLGKYVVDAYDTYKPRLG